MDRVSHVPVSHNGQVPEVCVVELGGTLGDLEGEEYLEAFRQFQFRVGPENFCSVHVAPIIEWGEFKTKPTQETVQELRRKSSCLLS